MTDLTFAVESIRAAQQVSGKSFAIVVAGHNGSGKSTMWYERLASEFQIPLINADRMMMSTLPEVAADKPLPFWATDLRDNDANWMQVAQSGVQAFVAQAMLRAAPFAMETVFSHWRDLGSGRFESKIDVIEDMQNAGYFVLLLFVGLSNAPLSNWAGGNTDCERWSCRKRRQARTAFSKNATRDSRSTSGGRRDYLGR